MRYLYSQVDKSNLDWFDKDTSKARLMRLEIAEGELRGLSNLKLHFRYPITAISGKNGTGKSTILACAACAFHNKASGFKTLIRRIPYYTFSDFFVQSAEEEPLALLYVRYQILYDNWRKTKHMPSGIGLGWQARRKLFGRWSNYASRVDRNVVFCGIERVVPHAEKSVSKSYRRVFQKGKATGYETVVAATVGRILGRPYEEFYHKEHSKYRLPLVKAKGRTYSGFNMGAGENTLFEILSIIYACEGSLLLVVDEMELGLHEEAQVRLIHELKELCNSRHIQVICTTHSPRILGTLPPEGRIHLERAGSALRVLPAISPEYAAGLLSGIKHAELYIYCEDDVAKELLNLALPNEIRSRVEIIAIGSATAIVRHLAAAYKEKSDRATCGFLDGDQARRKSQHTNVFLSTLEKIKDRPAATDWIENRLAFLPGENRPEKWIFKKVAPNVSENLAADFGVSRNLLESFVQEAVAAKDHTELHLLGQRLNLPMATIQTRMIRAALKRDPLEMERIQTAVRRFLL